MSDDARHGEYVIHPTPYHLNGTGPWTQWLQIARAEPGGGWRVQLFNGAATFAPPRSRPASSSGATSSTGRCRTARCGSNGIARPGGGNPRPHNPRRASGTEPRWSTRPGRRWRRAAAQVVGVPRVPRGTACARGGSCATCGPRKHLLPPARCGTRLGGGAPGK